MLVEVGVVSGIPKEFPTIMPDIAPYTSMIDGTMITSRSQHREHLKAHDCIEIGNDTKPLFTQYDNIPDRLSQSRHEIIRAQVDALTYREFKAIIRRDAQRVKWNSRKD